MELRSKEEMTDDEKIRLQSIGKPSEEDLKLNAESFNYSIIIPCYNEESRFPFIEFLKFAENNPNVLLCFVNDGSQDNTLGVLKGLQFESPQNISVYSCKQNGGKAEAIRQGMLYVYNNFKIPSMGFLDSECATTPEEWLLMAKFKEKYPQFGAIVGSRIQRLGVSIQSSAQKTFFGKMIKRFIKQTLKTPFQDIHCGAKIFMRSLVPFLFSQPFMTPWLFDVEIFLRLQKKFGRTTLQKGVLEYPLMIWTNTNETKVKFFDEIKMPFQLLRLHRSYNLAKK